MVTHELAAQLVSHHHEGWRMAGFARLLAITSAALALCLCSFCKYAPAKGHDETKMYTYFVHVSLMIFVGFGFLMTFLKRYSLSAVGLNFGCSVVMMVAAIVVRGALEASVRPAGMFAGGLQFIELNVQALISALFCSGAGMITFGAILGKASPLQLLALLLIEVPIFCALDVLCIAHFFEPRGATDIGGSMGIHAFGAYYGLAAAWRLYKHKPAVGSKHAANGSTSANDVTAMIGTIFLWVLWPSFNAAMADSVKGGRFFAIVNTVLAISGATLSTFAACILVHGEGRLDMVLVQNATLAGGVVIGSSVALPVSAGAAFALGLLAGCVSSYGFLRLSPFLEVTLGVRDTCGVHNLHGMPGILGGLAAAIALPSLGAPLSAAIAQLGTLLFVLLAAVAGGLFAGSVVAGLDKEEQAKLELFAFDDGAVWADQQLAAEATVVVA